MAGAGPVWRSPITWRSRTISSPAGNRVSRSTPSSSPSCVMLQKPASAFLTKNQCLRDRLATKTENVPLHARMVPRVPMMIQSPPSSRFKAFFAPLTARRQPDGPVTAGKLQSFEFNRYKGNLSVTIK